MRYIDADELKKAIINNFDNLQAYFPKDFIEEIDNAPKFVFMGKVNSKGEIDLISIGARTQDEWITIKRKLEDGKHSQFIYRCPLCGYIEVYKANFCAKCGADLRGGDS